VTVIKRKSNILFVLLTGLLLFPSTLLAEDESLPYFGMGAGARAVSMGGAFVALANDATAPYYNPAGLVQLERREVIFTIDGAVNKEKAADIFNENVNETIPTYLSFAFPKFALAWNKLVSYKSEDYELTVDAYSLSAARELGILSLGGTTTYLRSKEEEESESGYTADLGVLFDLGPFSLGGIFKNIINNLDFSQKYALGAAFKPKGLFTVTLQLDSYKGESEKLEKDEDYDLVRVGAEFWIIPNFFALRGGAASKKLEDKDNLKYSFGTGLNFGVFSLDLALVGENIEKIKDGGEIEEDSIISYLASATIRF
jgi:hypothetical protein